MSERVINYTEEFISLLGKVLEKESSVDNVEKMYAMKEER